MYGMLRNLARPFSYLGRKLAGAFGLGRKIVPRGVVIEKVIETGNRLNANTMPFKKLGMFEKGVDTAGRAVRYLRGADEMNKLGAFVNLMP